MEIKAVSREHDPLEIGVHKQDADGVLISLGDNQPWQWVSNSCAQALVDALLATDHRGAFDVLAERKRQQGEEGWDAAHDDEHDLGELALAAGCYALHAYDGFSTDNYCNDGSPYPWPWDRKWWKPQDMRRDMVRAAALLLAEIERIDRAAQNGTGDL